MVQEIHQAHDKFFKQSMSDVRVAIDFFKHYLPESILLAVDLSTVRCEKHLNPDLSCTRYCGRH